MTQERVSTVIGGLESITWIHLVFRFRFQEQAQLTPFLGSAIRGAFGRALKRASCPSIAEGCGFCALKGTCPYSYIFETSTPGDAEQLRWNTNQPHPFVIDPPPLHPDHWRVGETFETGVTLFGRAADYFPMVVLAFSGIGERGLGANRARFMLEEAWSVEAEGREKTVLGPGRNGFESLPERVSLADLPETPFSNGTVTIRFTTPARLSSEGRVVSRITFQILARDLLRRASSLVSFHCKGRLDADFRGIVELAGSIETVRDELKPEGIARYSDRQKRKIENAGLLGEAEFFGEGLQDFLPLLRLGEVIHAGKGSAWGLGRYVIAV